MMKAVLRSCLGAQQRAVSIMNLKNLKRRTQEERDAATTDDSSDQPSSKSTDPWMYRTLDEEKLGSMRSHELSLAHKLEFQRLYIPDLKLPSQDDIVKLGTRPIPGLRDQNNATFDQQKYTVEARKMFGKELNWGIDSIRMQLDGTFDPKTREDLTKQLRQDVPVPDLDWDVQFPMWNPRKRKPPRPRKGRVMYMYSLAKGQSYIFAKGQKGVYTRNISYRGLA